MSSQQVPHIGSVGDYVIKEQIGKGVFATVYRGEHRQTGEQVAVKVMNTDMAHMDERHQELVRREVRYWQRLRHSTIVKLIGYAMVQKRTCLVMEFLPGGTVGQRMLQEPNKRFSERNVQAIMFHVITAIAFCHQHKVAHRDIKPDNMLLDGKGRIKITDFGLCNTQEEGHRIKTMQVGSPCWMAPEVFHGNYDAFPADMWACGVNTLQLLTGKLPFKETKSTKLIQNIASLNYTMPDFISPNCRDFLERLLCIDPKQRMTAAECLQHPWLARPEPKKDPNAASASAEAKSTPQRSNPSSASTTPQNSTFAPMSSPREAKFMSPMNGELQAHTRTPPLGAMLDGPARKEADLLPGEGQAASPQSAVSPSKRAVAPSGVAPADAFSLVWRLMMRSEGPAASQEDGRGNESLWICLPSKSTATSVKDVISRLNGNAADLTVATETIHGQEVEILTGRAPIRNATILAFEMRFLPTLLPSIRLVEVLRDRGSEKSLRELCDLIQQRCV